MSGWTVGLGGLGVVPVFVPPTPGVTAGAHSHGSFYRAMPGIASDRYVDTAAGSNSNDGSLSAPWATIQYAITNCSAGATVGIRGGIYREALTGVNGKTVKLQPYPLAGLGISEQVTLDGTRLATVWTDNGNGTWSTSYSLTLDRLLGNPDTATLNSKYPGSARRILTDQCWFGDLQFSQVNDGAIPFESQFSVNQTTDKLTVGTDPAGQSVYISDKKQALVTGGRIDMAGFMVRRYSQDKVEFGNAMCYWGDTATGSRIEEMIFESASMVCVSMNHPSAYIADVTTRLSGYSGILMTGVNNLIMKNFHVHGHNKADFLTGDSAGEFASEPATAGVKITRCDNLSITQGIITDVPGGYGIWFDVSCTRVNLIDLDIDGLTTMVHGIELELSDGGNISGTQYQSKILNCRVRNTSYSGIKIFDTGYVTLWNCEISGTQVCFLLQQDMRVNSGTNPANRPASEVPWFCRNNDIFNSDLYGDIGYKLGIIAYDTGGVKNYKGGDMLRTMKSNRILVGSGGACVQLGKVGGSRLGYNNTAFLAAAVADVGGPFGTDRYDLNLFSNTTLPAAPIATPLPDSIATLMDLPLGTAYFGCDITRLPEVAA